MENLQRYYDLDNLATHLIEAQQLAAKLEIKLLDLDNVIAQCAEECAAMFD